jgi:cation diffusion facilitator family transporter
VALQADAWHLRTDVYTSAGVMGGLALILVGGWVFPGTDLYWIDPVAAIAVALLIMRTAYCLTLHATKDLLDVSLPADEEQWIREHVTSFAPKVRGFHRLRTRKAGPARFVEFHLLVDAAMSVEESHALADAIETDIEERFPSSSVSIHVEPCDGTCEEVCLDGCLVEDEERAELQRAAQRRPPRPHLAGHRPVR